MVRGLRRKMTTHFLYLIFVWLLSLKASSAATSGLNHSPTNVTPTILYQHQQTMQLMSTLDRHPSSDSIPSTVAEVKPQVSTTQTMTPERFQTDSQTAVTPISNTFNDSNNSMGTTELKSEFIKKPTFPTPEASNPTKPSAGSPLVSSYSQTQSTGKKSTSGVRKDEMTTQSHPLTQSILITTFTASIKSEDNTGTQLVPGGAWSSTTSAKPTTDITKANKSYNSKNGDNHSRIVAGLVGGALLLMMVGFLAIYIQKKNFQKTQIITADWAGPSPFLSGGESNDRFMLRSPNRISLSSFLPQRLSKRLSLLPEMDEELQDMTQSTTFEGKHQENMFGQGVDGKEPQDKSSSPVVTQEKENKVLQTNKSEAANLSQDGSAQHSNPSGGEENALGKNE